MTYIWFFWPLPDYQGDIPFLMCNGYLDQLFCELPVCYHFLLGLLHIDS